MARAAELLDLAKVGGERVRMYNLSAGEGAKFAAHANDMLERVEKLGPSPINIIRGNAPAPEPKADTDAEAKAETD